MKLVIGNKNYSTWSMRPWLMLDAFSIEFDEILESLAEPNLTERLLKHSDSARVPVLIDDDLCIWDSLAICEYLSETYLLGTGWPQDDQNRAIARAVTAEMHSGFMALRSELPMNCRASRMVEISDAAAAEIQRIDSIWSNYATPNANGDLRLFGEFSIADCFFAPVVMRFITYAIELSPSAAAYRDSLRTHPSVDKWVAQALQEEEIVEVDEAGVDH